MASVRSACQATFRVLGQRSRLSRSSSWRAPTFTRPSRAPRSCLLHQNMSRPTVTSENGAWASGAVTSSCSSRCS
uniref:Uncharacterized protein n=1 Tax=Globisporangium ultimum (strain ATCC 200006 / CBS 805.95 / DAOM BR144) TaxID=431595 RepID=K3WR12_GLOUD